MASQARGVEEQVALLDPDTLVARAGEGATIVLGVVRCVEGRVRVLGETLGTVPGHVLDGEERSVGAEKHIKVAGADDGVVCVFNDALKNTAVGGADGRVACLAGGITIAEDIIIRTLQPVDVERRVQRLLYVSAVEVDYSIGRAVVTGVDYAKLAVGVGARLVSLLAIPFLFS